ncbi:hypothetical protein Lser_V15G22620 [Lactuca serriola]
MDTSNWKPMECGDWRSQQQVASTQQIVNTLCVDYLQKISLKMQKFETGLQNLIPTANRVNPSHPGSQVTQQVNCKGQQQILPHIMHNYKDSTGIQELELEKIAQMFEENNYATATSKYEYCQRIMMILKMKSQKLMPDAMESNSGANTVNLSYSVFSGDAALLTCLAQHRFNWNSRTINDTSLESSDWRDQLQVDSRQWIVNTILDTLKRHLPFYEHEMLQEFEKIAVRFEEKIYTAATSQSDYIQKIFFKRPTMETISQYHMTYAMQSNYGANSVNPSNPAIGDSSGDWRSQLQANSRQKIVNKIMDTLKRHPRFSGYEGLYELDKIGEKFEEKIYAASTSQGQLINVALFRTDLYAIDAF